MQCTGNCSLAERELGRPVAGQKSESSEVGLETEILLGVLTAVEENSQVTQRSVASDLGIALGLANSYLKRCAKKGLIKIFQAPANRYVYYLTPKGFTEKSRLTAEYLSTSFNFFREARKQCQEVLDDAESRGWQTIAFCGASELVEIATLCSGSTEIKIAGIIDAKLNLQTFAGLEVFHDLATLQKYCPVDALVLTDIEAPQATFDEVSQLIPVERILSPRFLGISQRPLR